MSSFNHHGPQPLGRTFLAMSILVTALASTPGLAHAQASTSLDSCPARLPLLRIATVSGDESYTAHPAESRFSSTHYARLAHMPLFGADPLDSKVDTAFGVAESWTYLPGATGMTVKIKKGLTFNDGSPVTTEDVVFSIEATASKFADTQISGTLRGIGIKAKALDDSTVEISFSQGSPTFDLEMSPMVFPLYITSRAYHSNGEISQEAFDKFRSNPLAGVHSVYGPTQGWGPKHDPDVVAAIDRASRAGSLDDYTNAIADVGELVHDRAYGPGFFSSGALFFLRKGIPDWGVGKSVGRGPLNLAGLATKR